MESQKIKDVREGFQTKENENISWGEGAYYLYKFLNISPAQASSGKNITPVCTT